NDVFVNSNRLWHCSQCAAQSFCRQCISFHFREWMNRDANSKKNSTAFRQRDQRLMLNAKPHFTDSCSVIEAMKRAPGMLVQLRRAAESPIVPQPGGAGRELPQERVDLFSELRVQIRHHTVNLFQRSANFLF